MLEGDDPGGGAFALFLRPHPGAFRQLMCPHPGESAQFLLKIANARGLAQEGGGWALLELTDALLFTRVRHFEELQVKGNLFNCPQIWTVASLTLKKVKSCLGILYFCIFFPKAIFVRSLHNPISKMFCNFSL